MSLTCQEHLSLNEMRFLSNEATRYGYKLICFTLEMFFRVASEKCKRFVVVSNMSYFFYHALERHWVGYDIYLFEKVPFAYLSCSTYVQSVGIYKKIVLQYAFQLNWPIKHYFVGDSDKI